MPNETSYNANTVAVASGRTIQPVMVTIDRSPGENYLERTLDSLERSIAGSLNNLHVSDSGSSSYVATLVLRRKGCNYKEHEPSIVANLNVVSALTYGASTGADFVLFLEDDIDFIGDFYNSTARWLDDHISSLPIIYPLGANYGEVGRGYDRGETYWDYPVTKFYGTQAFLMRSQDVVSCCEYIEAHCYDLHKDGTGYDHLIRDWMLLNGVVYMPTPCPSFVQHIGTTSAIKRRTAIHTFDSYPGGEYVYKGVEAINAARESVAKRTVCIVTPARNARAHLELYFEQVVSLRNALAGDYHLRLVLAEGDSVDGTRDALQQYANRLNLDYTLVDTTHGGKYYRSVEDKRRLAMMSGVMSKGLAAARSDDTIVVWLMVDVKYSTRTIKELIASVENGGSGDVYAPLALSHDGTFYWDTWAFRQRGERFSVHEPHCEFNDNGLTEIDSAGTCLAMPSELARNSSLYPQDDEAVEFCDNVRRAGGRVYTSPDWRIYHNYCAPKRALVLGSFGSTSGYSRCVSMLLPELAGLSYEIDVIAVDWPAQRPADLPWNVWSAQQHPSDSPRGAHQLYRMLSSSRYDVCIILTDVYDVPSYAKAIIDARNDVADSVDGNGGNGNGGNSSAGADTVIAWCAVDSNNQLTAPALNAKSGEGQGEGQDTRNVFDNVIVWTKFAKDELQARGCEVPIDIIPLGVDVEVFKPDSSKRQDRKRLLLDPDGSSIPDTIRDAFLVGFVGRNQPRKRPDLAIAAFAKWAHSNPQRDSYLVMHCHPGDSYLGCDIEGLGLFYDLSPGQIIKYDAMLSDVDMAAFYRMLDVLIVTSTAEGFCLPVLEALACGTPAVVPDFGPLAEWSKGNVLAAKTIADTPVSPSNTAPYTMGREVDIVDVSNCISVVASGGMATSHGLDLAAAHDSQLVYRSLAKRIDQMTDKQGAVDDNVTIAA